MQSIVSVLADIRLQRVQKAFCDARNDFRIGLECGKIDSLQVLSLVVASRDSTEQSRRPAKATVTMWFYLLHRVVWSVMVSETDIETDMVSGFCSIELFSAR